MPGRKRGVPYRHGGPGTLTGPFRHFATALALLIAVACGSTTSPAASTTGTPTQPASTLALPSGTASGPTADAIFTSANVVTMDDAHPRAQAVAIKGDKIMAVGSAAEIAALQGPGTAVADLGGRTLVPGFIDAHQHRIGDGPDRLGKEPKQLIDDAIQQGYTTIDELYVDDYRLGVLRDLDTSGVLRLRVNAYLPVQENSETGTLFDPYYEAYRQGQVVSPHVRVAGLKVFTDFNNATILLWKQADLDAFLLARHKAGWHLAIKTVSTTSLAMILKAMASVKAADPTVVAARVRTEHTLFATADQIASMKSFGMVPTINLNLTGDLVRDPGVAALVDREPKGSLAPWRSLFEAGITPAGITGFPSGYVDEPTGAPWGSPMRLVYESITRTGTTGPPPAGLLEQALTAEQALRALTIDAARAGWEDDVKGSISTGKLADLVVLSADPLTSDTGAIKDIGVLMTMIGGKVEWCAPGSESVCPVPGSGGGGGTGGSPGPPLGGNIAPTAAVTASSVGGDRAATNVIDGSDAYWKAEGPPPQWVELRFPSPVGVGAVRLRVSQRNGGPSVHELWIQRTGSQPERVHVFDGTTNDGDVLVYQPDAPIAGVESVKVVTTSLAGGQFPAWQEIEVIAP